jgi:hypothetical protein
MGSYDDLADLQARLFTRYARARVLLEKLSDSIRDLTIPLAVIARHEHNTEWQNALHALIDTPVEMAEVFDLLIKTDLVEMLETCKKEIEKTLAVLEDYKDE